VIKLEPELTQPDNLIAESWFSSMPPMTREIISARMCNVTAAHKLTRAARNAVTSAYCAILKRNRSSTPRHHGSRVSSDRGAGWLRWQAEEDPARTSIGYVLRMDDPASRLHEQVERHLNGRNQETEYKLEATLNVVGWEQKASEFFQSALSSLESETATLETKLWAIMDLQLYR